MKEYYIVSCAGLFLVAVAYTDTKVTRWSASKWDAARIRRLRDARRVAEKVSGNVFQFNPLTGDITEVAV